MISPFSCHFAVQKHVMPPCWFLHKVKTFQSFQSHPYRMPAMGIFSSAPLPPKQLRHSPYCSPRLVKSGMAFDIFNTVTVHPSGANRTKAFIPPQRPLQFGPAPCIQNTSILYPPFHIGHCLHPPSFNVHLYLSVLGEWVPPQRPYRFHLLT